MRVGLSGSEQCFEYGLGPFRQAVHSQDWTSLTSTEATYPHIRLHQLREEDSFSDFFSTMASIPATMAVVLINSEDSYTLTGKFHSEEQTPPVPMLVVTKETGGKLLQLVEDHPRDVQIKIDQLLPEQVEIGGIVTAGHFRAQKIYCLHALDIHVSLDSSLEVYTIPELHASTCCSLGAYIHMYLMIFVLFNCLTQAM